MEERQNNGKVILNLAVSLEGYMEGPNGEIDGLNFFGGSCGKELHKFLKKIDTIPYGRISFEKWGTYIPTKDIL